MKTEIPVIVAARRTPIGRHGGGLASVRPDDLLALIISDLLKLTGIPPTDIGDVIVGCANQAGEDNRNVARMASLLAGLPWTVTGVTINRLCGSSLDAVIQAARAVTLGDAEVILATGVESMSRAPWSVPKPEVAYATGTQSMYDTSLGWRFPNPRLAILFPLESMGETAENLAQHFRLDRDLQDAYAYQSHQRALLAQAQGWFAAEILPVSVAEKKQTRTIDTDEGPRPDTTPDRLAKLKPAFRDPGTVTAGNSSTLNDGAAGVVITSERYASARKLPILSRIAGWGVAGVDPRHMGLGPVPATVKALNHAGWKFSDLEAIELNKAFAAQSLSVLRSWEMPYDSAVVNAHGGAIALGHPLGASGARITATLLHRMQQHHQHKGLATMCIGVGQGISVLLEC